MKVRNALVNFTPSFCKTRRKTRRSVSSLTGRGSQWASFSRAAMDARTLLNHRRGDKHLKRDINARYIFPFMKLFSRPVVPLCGRAHLNTLGSSFLVLRAPQETHLCLERSHSADGVTRVLQVRVPHKDIHCFVFNQNVTVSRNCFPRHV